MTRNYLLRSVLAIAVMVVGISVYSQSTSISCEPSVNNSNKARIRLFKLDGKKYVTHGTYGYNDWRSNVNIPIAAGHKYPIRLQPYYLQKEIMVYWKIWIDYNMDGDFTDLYEYACYGKGIGSINGQLNIPNDIWNGEATMRVAISIDDYPSGPCDAIDSGEVEDYTISISEGKQIEMKDIPRGGLCVHMPSKLEDTTKETASKESKTLPKTPIFASKEKTAFSFDQCKFSIYPNPSIYYSIVTLSIDGIDHKVDNLYITDLEGRMIANAAYTHLDDNSYKINTHSLHAGVYIITAIKEGKSFSSRLIVAK